PIFEIPRAFALFSFPFSVLMQAITIISPIGVAIPYPLLSSSPPIWVRLQSRCTI
ncbi:GSCOCG00005821001-RA-CDS, partial [Cotesia congregata]